MQLFRVISDWSMYRFENSLVVAALTDSFQMSFLRWLLYLPPLSSKVYIVWFSQIFHLFYPHSRKPLRSTRLKLSTFWSSSISLRKILFRDSFSGSAGSSWLSSPYLFIFFMASLLSSIVNLISTPFELTRNILRCWSRVLALYNCFKALHLQLHSLGF